MQRSVKPKVGSPGYSPALKFELELQELQGGGAPRVAKCFQVFDELIPCLGAYQRVMQLLRQELYVAVYSSDCTSGKTGDNTNLTAVPYSVIAKRLLEKKAGERSKFKSEISSLKEQLYICEADLEKALSSLDTCRHDLKDRDAKLHHLMSELRNQCAEKQHLQEIIGSNQHSQERLCQDFDFRMFTLRNTLTTLKEENGKLRRFKATHDRLQGMPLLTVHAKDEVEPAICKNELEQHVTCTKKLKVQLLTLQNSLMDELDAWLQVCYSKQSQVLPVEVSHKKKTFKQKISALSTELTLLDKHQQALCERLEQLSTLESTSAHTALVLPLHPHNPLIPQDQLSNKYAAMIYTSSDGGKHFYPLKVAQYCASCAQKTVVCPHKICEKDLVIQIPVNSSHIKISRPHFQLFRLEQNPCLTVTKKVTEDIQDVRTSINQGLHIAVPDFGYLWTQFKHKFPNHEIMVCRQISQVQLLDLVGQLYASLLQKDDRILAASGEEEEDDQASSLPESLFEFMKQHYMVKSLAPISCHSFIVALEEFYSKSKELLVLSHSMCGDLDGCGFRYILLQADLVGCVMWNSHLQFHAFVSSLYPFLAEEDVEQLGLNYVAHSDNQLSAHLVLEFMQILLLAHKDPLVIMLENKLAAQPCRVAGCMLETEFAETMEKLVPSCSDLLCHRLFLQSLETIQEKCASNRQTLPTRRLAYIAAYLYRLNKQDQLRAELVKLNPISTAGSKQKEEFVFQHSMRTIMSLIEKLTC